MTKRWILDANAIVNLCFTFSLMQKYENVDIEPFFLIFDRNHHDFITTTTVMQEVSSTIHRKLSDDPTPSFYKSDQCKILISGNEKRFKSLLEIKDVSKNPDMIYLTGGVLKNAGEKSLVTAYLYHYYSLKGATKFVSNDHDDVVKNLNRICSKKQKQQKQSDSIISIFEFIQEIYAIAGLSNQLTAYTIFVSNIEAQVFKRDKISSILQLIIKNK